MGEAEEGSVSLARADDEWKQILPPVPTGRVFAAVSAVSTVAGLVAVVPDCSVGPSLTYAKIPPPIRSSRTIPKTVKTDPHC